MNILLALLDLFYPRLCLRCGRSLTHSEEFLCAYCIADIPRTDFHLHPGNNPAEEALGGKVYVKEVYSWFYFSKKGSYSNLIYSLKYKGKSEFARYLGTLYAMELTADGKLKDIDYIVPVPLHKKRMKTRGYNQSEMIASGVAGKTDGTLRTDILRRSVATETQIRKSRYDRWLNIKDAFVAEPAAEEDRLRSVLLVDDVMTTGSTLLSCINALHEAGYENISVLTLSFAENR